MKIRRIISLILAILSPLLFLSSCGDSTSDILAGGGIGGTGYTSSGTITAFGSVVVNGVTFDTTEAIVSIGGQEKGTGNQVVLNYLDIGKVVLVEGKGDVESSSGIARRVMYSPNVVGPVSAASDIGQKIRMFKILGQTIIANSETIFSSGSLESIREDNLLEVSGLVDDEGRIRATYIKRIANSYELGAEVEVKGFIQNLDLANKTFQINELQISYGQAQMVNLGEGGIEAGLQVHVRGRIAEHNQVYASEIRLAEENRIANAEWADIEAFITDFAAEDDFSVGLFRVRVRENARFMNGERRDLRKGIKIRIRGKVMNKVMWAQIVAILEK